MWSEITRWKKKEDEQIVEEIMDFIQNKTKDEQKVKQLLLWNGHRETEKEDIRKSGENQGDMFERDK